MFRKAFVITLAAPLIFMLIGCKFNEGGKEMSKKDQVTALLKALETGTAEPVAVINPQKYIQHNLAVPDGLNGFGEFFAKLPKNSVKVNTVRVFQDGEFVFTQSEYEFFGPKVGYDVFRFEDGKIVEHWDGLADKKPANPSGHTQFDGETKITDTDKTEQNRKLVGSFIKDILIDGKVTKITDYISTQQYIQHNTDIADGLDGLGSALNAMAKAEIKMVYSKNHKVLAEGNFVLSMSEGTFAGKHVAFYDLFRIENGKLVEHWDAIEEIPSEDKWANKNGKF
jgi:predicted SnoaL-like aldol condensation-catalyzing enzyme